MNGSKRETMEVVRCKNCKFGNEPGFITKNYGVPGTVRCDNWNSPCHYRLTHGDGYCPFGIEKEESC